MFLFEVHNSLLSYLSLTGLLFKDLNLPHLPRLCSVQFGADTLAWGSEHKSREVVRMLAQITSQEVQEVGVAFDALSVAEMEGVDWYEMSRILERPNFSELKRVSILAPLDGDIKEIQAWIVQRLPSRDNEGDSCL